MEILRYAAFSSDPAGGNPAGVVLDATGLDDSAMSTIAAEVGFSETAFVFPEDSGDFNDESTSGDAVGDFTVRYFSPLREVPFCGHATIATAVAYAQRHGVGNLRFQTKAGLITISTNHTADGSILATLISVPPRSVPISASNLTELLVALRWSSDDLDVDLPPRVAYAGAWHPIIAAKSRDRLSNLDYDLNALTELMLREDWTTVDLVWQESLELYHSRNPFPIGGVVEDPATGAAAAAFGGYLRELALVPTPATITVQQGQDMGRSSTIAVTIEKELDSGIVISGTAVQL